MGGRPRLEQEKSNVTLDWHLGIDYEVVLQNPYRGCIRALHYQSPTGNFYEQLSMGQLTLMHLLPS